MTLHVVHATSATDREDLAALDTIRLPGFEVTANAEEGSAALSQVKVEDIGGTLDLVGLRRVWVWESAEDAGNEMIWTGYWGDRDISRGEDSTELVTGLDRWWSAGLVEANTLLSRRLVTGADGDRPAETDIARITWLLSSDYLQSVGNTLGYIDSNAPVDMDAADLRGQSAYQVLQDCANRSNKNYHLVYTGDTSPPSYGGTYSLVYQHDFAPYYSSTVRLTDTRADVDNATTFYSQKTRLRRTPERVYSGVMVRYTDGLLYAQDTATKNAFAARDAAHQNANISTVTVAQALATRYLNDADTEEDRIYATVVVPKEKVNHLREGQRLEIKFSWMPDYGADYTWARCVRRTVRQLSDDFYQWDLELSPQGVGVPAQAGIFFSNEDNGWLGNTTTVSWRKSGDSDPMATGSTVDPLSGPLEYVVGANTPPYASGGGWWNGIKSLSSGILNVNFVTDLGDTTRCSAPTTAYWQILLNGSVIAETTQTSPTTGCFADLIAWGPTGSVDATVAVTAGDVLTARVVVDEPVGGRVIPLGVGQNANRLFVEGTLDLA